MTEELCQCEFCKLSRHADEVIATRDPDALILLVEELLNMICNIGEDRSYKSCILDGSWPSAVEQLERALDKAKKIREATKT